MNIGLTPDQESLIRSKLETGRYNSVEEVLEVALDLLDRYDRADTAWAEDVREKVDAAIVASEQTPPIDGETFINGILDRFEQKRVRA